MNKRIIASLKLKFRRDAALAGYANAIIYRLTGNLYYPVIFPERIAVELALDEYIQSLSAAADGGRSTTARKRTARHELQTALILLSHACITIANGNTVVFLSSGFHVRKRNAPLGLLERVTNLRVLPGSYEGSFELVWDSMPKANAFHAQLNVDNIEDDNNWETVAFPTKSKIILHDLMLAKRFWFRVAAIGSAGQGAWSNPVSRISA